ncbi:hypothetical protein ACFSTH_06165 [Paenibacillus yanchengensis]|uniref:Uncharacterized protein n=1 Tax=Paenibacillus yanchengensis TaxID=2035833 RepID=A0ABW4YHA0_9BACL
MNAAKQAGYLFGRKVDLGAGWSFREDSGSPGNGTKDHTRQWFEGKTLVSNEDGTIHDKKMHSSGDLPDWVRDGLKKKGDSDWDENKKKQDRSYKQFKSGNDPYNPINSEDLVEKRRAKELWKLNAKMYWTEFLKLRKRLPDGVFDIFEKNDFHDFEIKECLIQQTVANAKPAQFQLNITDGYEEWVIKYSKINKLCFKYDSDTCSEDYGINIDCWGYHELLEIDENNISHEILFSSGTTLLVCFEDKGLSVEKVR